MSGTEVLHSDGQAIVPMDGDDLMRIAEQAERRIDAVIKIKRVALKVTNAMDWVDQKEKPYLMASGSEKVANLFNISWRLLTPEPTIELEPDGNYTYTYQGEFSMGNRTIQCEGSRSSRDKFFSQYEGSGDARKAKSVEDRDNRRDVKMAAYTNLLGNGITRILGIRNLTYADLLEFAGIKKEQLQKVEYKVNPKANVKAAEEKKPEGAAATTTDQKQQEQREPGQGDEPPAGELDVFQKLELTLRGYCGGEEQVMKGLLKELTKFTGTDGKEHYKLTVDQFKRDEKGMKWAGSTLRKLEEKIAKEQGA